MEDDDDNNPTRNAYEKGLPRPEQPRLVHNQEPPTGPFALRALYIQDQTAIPHRQWIYGTQLIRGFVTLLVAPGGTGKSSLLLALCMAIATGRALLGARVHQQCNTAILNLEDPQDEIDRRVAALALHYGLANFDIANRLFASPAERTINIAKIGEDGFSVIHPDEKHIIERVRDLNIGVLAVDPFAESHTLEENSNPAMVAAAASWRRVARAGNCSVVLAHHVRKGMVDSIEAARGAKALTDSSRIGLLLSTMTEDDAGDLGIKPEDRLQYVRLDDAKANMAARAPKASWFRLTSLTLNNADAVYPKGDQVGVIEEWKPVSVWEKVPRTKLNEVLDLIEAGLPGGERYGPTKRGIGGKERWAGTLLMRHCEITDGQAEAMLATWTNNGVLEARDYHSKGQRKVRQGLFVNATKRPGVVSS